MVKTPYIKTNSLLVRILYDPCKIFLEGVVLNAEALLPEDAGHLDAVFAVSTHSRPSSPEFYLEVQSTHFLAP